MKEYSKLFIFIIVLGLLVSGIYVGMSILTDERIEANKLYELKVATLSHNNADTSGGMDQAFENDITILEKENHTFYLYQASNNDTQFEGISIIFNGDGLWGRIRGIITFESDFVTIKNISILEQSETPGLGGKIVTREFLDKFIGKRFDPNLVISPGSGQKPDNEVDAITGATGTSVAFQNLLNVSYQNHFNAFFNLDPSVERLNTIKKTVLFNLGIEFTEENFLTIFEDNLVTQEFGSFVFYTTSNTVSYVFSGQGAFGLIEGVMTLEEDFETIIKISVFESSEEWGAQVVDRDYLDSFTNKKFINDEIIFTANPVEDNEVDVIGRGTTTQRLFPVIINSSYQNHKAAFEGDFESVSPEALRLNTIKKTILFNLDIEFTEENFKTVFDDNVDSFEANGLVFYESENAISYIMTTEGFFGPIEAVMTLDKDFETIIKLSVFESSENWGNQIVDRDYLDTFTNKKFINDELVFTANPVEDNEVDVIGRGTTTQRVFPEMINEAYSLYKAAYESHSGLNNSNYVHNVRNEVVLV